MTLREARPDDWPAIEELTRRLADFERPPGRTAREISVADHAILRAQFAAPDAAVLFLVWAAPDGEVLGTVFANTRRDYFTGNAHAYVEVLAVAEWAAGRGVARALMEAVEAWGRGLGMVRVDLSVFAANRRARGLYEHLGYHAEIVRYAKPLG